MATVVFDVKNGYDEEMWDDTALIKAYDKAKESSRRELIRTRKKGGKSNKRTWDMGQPCRAIFSEDGEEYEGTIVYKNFGNKSVTVRFHGYNNEEEIPVRDLMESLGTDAVEEQIEQAKRDDEVEEEEEGAGDEFRVGDWCRAEWSQDGEIYEAVIESTNKKKETAVIRFIGFNNQEEKDLHSLYLSKGDERREYQERMGEEDVIDTEEGIHEDEIHNLIAKNCPDLLANFGNAEEGLEEDLDLEKLTIQTKTKQKEKKKPEKERLTGEAPKTEIQEKSKIKVKKIKKQKQSLNSSINPTSFPSWDWQAGGIAPQSMTPFPSPMYPPHGPMYPQTSPMYPQTSPMYPQASPMHPQHMMPQPLPPMHLPMPPADIPPPPMLEGMMEGDQALHSLLLSWYMAGYQAGLYQQTHKKPLAKTGDTTKKKSTKK